MSEEKKHRPKAYKKPPPKPVRPTLMRKATYGGKKLKTPSIGSSLGERNSHHRRQATGFKKRDTTKEI